LERDLAAEPINRVRGGGIPVVVPDADQIHQLSSGGEAHGTEPGGIDTPVSHARADQAQRALGVGQRFDFDPIGGVGLLREPMF
jgi:hypothetical protein